MHNITKRRLQDTMNDKKISLSELSRLTDIPKTTLHRYLDDPSTIPLDRIQVIAKKLMVSPQFLMGWDEFDNFEKELESAKRFFYNDLGFTTDDDLMETLDNHSLLSLYKEIKNIPDLTKETISRKVLGYYTNYSQEQRDTYGDHNANLKYFSDNPEFLEMYKDIYENETLQLLFDKTHDLEPEDLEAVIQHIQLIRKARGLE